MVYKIAVLVGSLRKDSLNRKLAKQLVHLAPDSLELKLIDISDLPVYNSDLDDEGTVPKPWTRFREEMRAFQGILFVTPEYNRSVPGGLKNAIDVGSRPYGKSIWQDKPGAIISVSPSSMGGFGANHHLRQSMVFLNVPIMQQPEAYTGKADSLFDENNEIVSEDTRKFMQSFMIRFSEWVSANAKTE